MNKIHTVVWSRAVYEPDSGRVTTNSGVYSAHNSNIAATKSLSTLKHRLTAELFDAVVLNAKQVDRKESYQVAGSAKAGYFRLTFIFDGCPTEIYLHIDDTTVSN
jgi:hypothetical protein